MAAPRIPGMEDYPQLREQYEARYRRAALAANRKGGRCSNCDTAEVISAYKRILARARTRDNPRRKA